MTKEPGEVSKKEQEIREFLNTCRIDVGPIIETSTSKEEAVKRAQEATKDMTEAMWNSYQAMKEEGEQ